MGLRDLLIGVGADLTELRRDLARGPVIARQFVADMGSALGRNLSGPKVDTSALRAAGAAAGQNFMVGFRAGIGSGSTNAFDGLNSGIGQLRTQIASAFAVREVVQMSDAWTNSANRLGLVAKNASEVARFQRQLFDVAQLTRTEYGATVALFTKLDQSASKLGLTQAQTLRITETVNKAFQVSGATANEARQGVLQLGQALASGVLRGDEFNTISEAAPRLRDAIADMVGVSIGELRKMAEAGQLTSDVVSKALLQAAPGVDAEFKRMQLTIGGAFTQMTNAATRFVGEQGQMTGGALALSGAMSAVARNFDVAATAGVAFLAVIAARRAGNFASGIGTQISQGIAGFNQQRVAIEDAARAEVRLAAAATQTAAAQRAAATQAVSGLTQVRASLQATMDLERQRLAASAIRLQQPALAPNTALGGRAYAADVAARTAAQRVLDASSKALLQTELALANVERQLAGATTQVAAADTAAAAAKARAASAARLQAAAMASSTLAATAGAAAMRGLGLVVGALGGPVGIGILAITGLVLWLQKSKAEAEKAKNAILDFKNEASGLSAIKFQVKKDEVNAALTEARLNLALLEQQSRNINFIPAGTPLKEIQQARADAEKIQPQLTAARNKVNELMAQQKALGEIEQENIDRMADSAVVVDAAVQAEAGRLAKLRDLGQASREELARITQIVEKDQKRLNELNKIPVNQQTDRMRTERIELAQRIAALKRETKGDREIEAQLRLQTQQAADALRQFKARAEASIVRLDLAFQNSADIATQENLLAGVRAEYAAVTAEVDRQGRSARANLQVLRVQLELARAIEDQLVRVGERAAVRVDVTANFNGFSFEDQQAALADLRDRYADIVAEVNRQGGPLRASTTLIQQQIKLAEMLGETYARALKPTLPPAAQTLAAPDPAVIRQLQAVRDALEAVEKARTEVRLNELAGPSGASVAAVVAANARLSAATDAVAERQLALRAILAATAIPMNQQQGILEALAGAYRDVGMEVEEVTQRAAQLARTRRVLVLPPTITIPRISLPPVEAPLEIDPRLSIRLTTGEVQAALPPGPFVVTLPVQTTLAPEALAGARERVEEAFKAVREAASRIETARVDLQLDVVSGDTEGVRAANKELEALREQARNAAAEVARAAEALPEADRAAVLERIKAAMEGISENVATDDIREFSTALRAVASGVQGALSIADAFGEVDDAIQQSVNSLAGMLNSLASAADLIKQMKETAGGPQGIAGLFQSLAGISSVIGVIGGVAGMVAPAFQESPGEKEHRDLLKQNNEELRQVSLELRGLIGARGAFAATQALTKLSLTPQQLKDIQLLSGLGQQKNIELAINNILKDTGLSLKDLAAIAKDNGLEILDSKGRIVAEAFGQLQERLAQVAIQLTQFQDTVDSQRTRMQLRDELGLTPGLATGPDADTINEVNRELNILKQLAPRLGAEFFGLSVETREGRAAIREGLRDLFKRIDAGELTLEDLGGIENLDELLGIIGNINDGLEEFGTALFAWASDFAALRDQMSFAREIRDQEGPEFALEDAAAIFKTLAPDLYDRIFAGVDLGAASGRALLNTRLNDILDEMLSPDFAGGQGWLQEFLAASGFKDLGEFQTALLGVDSALDELGKQAAETKKDLEGLGNIPEAFKRSLEQRRFEVQTIEVVAPVVSNPVTSAPVVNNPPSRHPTLPPVAFPRQASETSGGGPAVVQHFAAGAIQINGAEMSAAELYREWYREARRIANANGGANAKLDKAWEP